MHAPPLSARRLEFVSSAVSALPERGPFALTHELERLRRELVDQAFILETRGRADAADLALSISARLAELTITTLSDTA